MVARSNLVVLVDDEVLLCKAFKAILSREGVVVETFTDAESALEFIATHDVGVVVSDFRMPGITGLQLLARIGKPIPFYLVTGDLDVERLSFAGTGVTGVLTKPFDARHLLMKIRAHIDA